MDAQFYVFINDFLSWTLIQWFYNQDMLLYFTLSQPFPNIQTLLWIHWYSEYIDTFSLPYTSVNEWMIGVLGHNSALLRLYWAVDKLS